MTGRSARATGVRLRITGRVHGVGFRYAACAEARRLGIRGWVRNTADGAVELLAEGDEARLHLLIAWCQAGPRGARVDGVEEQGWQPATGEFTDFRIAY